MEINYEQLLLATTRYKEITPQFINANPRYIQLYIGSINQTKLLFTDKANNKVFPDFSLASYSKFNGFKGGDMVGAAITKYGDAFNSDYYNLQPFEMMFNGHKSGSTLALWSLHLCFFVPYPLNMVMKSLEIKELKMLHQPTGSSFVPEIQLDERWIENNEIKFKRHFSEKLPMDVPHKVYMVS